MKKMRKKVTAVLERLKLSSVVFLATLKGGDDMMVKYLVSCILSGDLTLEEIKNKKLLKLVKAELEKAGLSELADAK